MNASPRSDVGAGSGAEQSSNTCQDVAPHTTRLDDSPTGSRGADTSTTDQSLVADTRVCGVDAPSHTPSPHSHGAQPLSQSLPGSQLSPLSTRSLRRHPPLEHGQERLRCPLDSCAFSCSSRSLGVLANHLNKMHGALMDSQSDQHLFVESPTLNDTVNLILESVSTLPMGRQLCF